MGTFWAYCENCGGEIDYNTSSNGWFHCATGDMECIDDEGHRTGFKAEPEAPYKVRDFYCLDCNRVQPTLADGPEDPNNTTWRCLHCGNGVICDECGQEFTINHAATHEHEH